MHLYSYPDHGLAVLDLGRNPDPKEISEFFEYGLPPLVSKNILKYINDLRNLEKTEISVGGLEHLVRLTQNAVTIACSDHGAKIRMAIIATHDTFGEFVGKILEIIAKWTAQVEVVVFPDCDSATAWLGVSQGWRPVVHRESEPCPK